MYKQSSRSNAPLLPKRKTGAPKLVQFGRYYSHVAYYQHPKISTPSQAVVKLLWCAHQNRAGLLFARKNSKNREFPLAGSQMKGNLDRLNSGQICRLVPLWPFAVRDRFLAKKIQPFSLFWVPLFTWNLFGSWNARFANSPTQLPLKSSVHTHA